jgi:ankyrin repeat protein
MIPLCCLIYFSFHFTLPVDPDDDDCNEESATTSSDMERFTSAAYHGDIDTMNELHQQGISLDTLDAEPALCAATHGQQVEAVKWLLEHGASRNVGSDANGCMALHIAASDGNLDIVKILVKSSAQADIKDKNGDTPFDLAVLGDHVDVAYILLSYLDKLSKIDGNSAFHIASLIRHSLDITVSYQNILRHIEEYTNAIAGCI